MLQPIGIAQYDANTVMVTADYFHHLIDMHLLSSLVMAKEESYFIWFQYI